MGLCTHDPHFFNLHAVAQVQNIPTGGGKSWGSGLGSSGWSCQPECPASSEVCSMASRMLAFFLTKVSLSSVPEPLNSKPAWKCPSSFLHCVGQQSRTNNGKRLKVAWASFCDSGKFSPLLSLHFCSIRTRMWAENWPAGSECPYGSLTSSRWSCVPFQILIFVACSCWSARVLSVCFSLLPCFM